MSNGYLLAAEADIAAAREIGDGFGLDVIAAGAIGDHETTGAALAAAANVGLILSAAAAQDQAFVALLQSLAQRLPRAQLILVEPEARAAFAFLPETWPAMSLEEARARSSELARQRQAAAGPPTAAPAPEAAPEAPAQPEAPPQPSAEPGGAEAAAPSPDEQPPSSLDSSHGGMQDAMAGEQERAADAAPAEEAPAPPAEAETQAEPSVTEAPAEVPEPPTAPPAGAAPEPPPMAAPMPQTSRAPEPPAAEAPAAGAPVEPPPPAAGAPARKRDEGFGAPVDMHSTTANSATGEAAGRLGETAPADATAFAPKKLRRETPELVRVVMHQPKDLQAVIKAARKIDPSATPAPQGMSIGEVALGASVGVALEVRGAACDGTLQRRKWMGEPIDFAFTVEAEAGVKQAVFIARVFIDDAQIGVIAFTRPIKGPAKKPADVGDRLRLKRHKRVFLSYSSQDREVVSAIATAYEMAGVQHFWDRASLKSGEEWSPRLRREIDRADLFHLCWSKAAAGSEWVEKEAERALTRRRRTNGRKPEITVQMLDGPPWAPHPPSLASINFDDFVRAAIVGYARGEG